MLDDQRVAKGPHVVVQEHGHAGDLSGQGLPQVGVGRVVEMQGADAAARQEGAGAPADVGVADDDDGAPRHVTPP